MTIDWSQVDWTKNHTDASLMQWYQDYRDRANEVALALESRGYIGEYLRGESNEWKPLDPTTRPTQFQFRKPE